MSAYRGGAQRRPPELEPRPRSTNTALVAVAVLLGLGGGALFLVNRRMSRERRPVATAEVSIQSVASASAPPSAPTRPESFSDRQHLATTAAISLANTAMLSNRDVLARKAMAMADAITDPKTTCAEYDAAFVGLRQELLGVPDAGDLGDAAAELDDIERARCVPGSDAG